MQSFRTLWNSRRRHVSLAVALLASVACASGELQEGLGPQSEAKDSAVGVQTGSEAAITIQGLTLSPTSATVAPGASQQFTAVGWINGSIVTPPGQSWTATGGTVSSSGLYTAGSTPGTYSIKVVSAPTYHEESATITISGTAQPAATVSSVVVSPSGRTTVYKGATQQFTATAQLSNGSTQNNASVTWSATGGTISSSGAYKAGNTSGYFRVIGRSNGKADTSDVTIPTTSATINSIIVTPATASVAASAAQQFSVSAKLMDGSTLSTPSVTWSATGGSVNSSGRYTAGSAAGNYRVIARSSNGKADTSAVTVTAAAQATVTAVSLTPASVNLSAGATQAFSTQVTYSNGTTQTNPTLTWSATGGSMGSGQVYTAGGTTGSYQVIATLNGRADTSVVNVTAVSQPPAGGGTGSAPYFNSAEAGCGTDPNVILCDDFDDGSWYDKHCDAANASGGLTQTDGWCGTIYNNAGLSAGTTRCGSVGVKSNCVATTGTMSGGTTGNMGDHALNGGGVDEIWVRFYTKPLSGYTFGAEKMLTFNDGVPGGGGIRYGNLSWNCASSPASTGQITMGFPVPMDVCQRQNQGNNITIESGNWYFYEVHYKLSSPGQSNGVFELWVNNCGADGNACSGTPTLRMRRTDVNNNRASSNELIRTLWFEAWSNPVSRGERYWDQIKVAKVGPIGFMR